MSDERTRALERAVTLGDEVAARALLVTFVRTGAGAELAERLPIERLGGRDAFGPLMLHETERLREGLPELVVEGHEGAWVGDRGVMGAILHLRLLELELVAATAPDRPVSRRGLHQALDLGGGEALERVARAVRDAPHWAAVRAATILAERASPEAAVRLAQVALEAPAEARARAYNALAQGRVSLDLARPLLARALAREKPELRKRAFDAFARGALDADLQRLRRDAPPDVRAHAFEVIVARAIERGRGHYKPADLVVEALSDTHAELRRAAVRVLEGREWERDPRAHGWLMGRLLDPDRQVKAQAKKLLRRRDLAPKDAPRLRTIAERAPPSLRPPIHRLADRAER